MKAILNNYRQSPRKVRMVANLVKGKSVNDALATLTYLPKRAGTPIKKLIESALANVKNTGVAVDTDKLIVKNIAVNSAFTMKRMMPGSRGRGFILRKKASRVFVSLSEKPAKKLKSAKNKISKK